MKLTLIFGGAKVKNKMRKVISTAAPKILIVAIRKLLGLMSP